MNWQFPHRLRYQIPDIPNKFRQTSLTNTSPTPSTVSRFQRGDNEIYVTQFSLLHPPQCSTVSLLHQSFHFNQSFTNVPHLFFRTVSIHLKKKKNAYHITYQSSYGGILQSIRYRSSVIHETRRQKDGER